MRLLSLLAVFLLASSLPARDEGKAVKETWDAIYFGAARAGHAHTTIRQVSRDGKPVLVATLATSLRLKRYQEVVSMGLTQRCEETLDGKVQRLGVTTKLDKGEIVQDGRVEGDTLIVQVQTGGRSIPLRLPWQADVIGLARQEDLWVGRKLAAGGEVRYKTFDPSVNAVVALSARVGDREEVLVLIDKGTPEKPRGEQVLKSLWRVTVSAEPVEVAGKKLTLPGQTLWIDDTGTTLRSDSEIPGLGKITTFRVTRGLALSDEGSPAELPDLGLSTLVKLAQPIPKAHQSSQIVYRITVKGDAMPQKAFSEDARQKPGTVRGDQFELTVRAVREPAGGDASASPGAEYLRSTHLLDSNDERIQNLAKKIVAGETDAWKKARKLERWVHDNMRPTAAVGLVKASQICTDLQGDCRQHGMLLAALCRASGVPARTAQGLVYVHDRKNGPVFGFHLWTEVWVQGQWMSLDATLGQGSVGPAHLKIGDSSWKDGEGLAPLLTLVQVLGRLQIKTVSVE